MQYIKAVRIVSAAPTSGGYLTSWRNRPLDGATVYPRWPPPAPGQQCGSTHVVTATTTNIRDTIPFTPHCMFYCLYCHATRTCLYMSAAWWQIRGFLNTMAVWHPSTPQRQQLKVHTEVCVLRVHSTRQVSLQISPGGTLAPTSSMRLTSAREVLPAGGNSGRKGGKTAGMGLGELSREDLAHQARKVEVMDSSGKIGRSEEGPG